MKNKIISILILLLIIINVKTYSQLIGENNPAIQQMTKDLTQSDNVLSFKNATKNIESVLEYQQFKKSPTKYLFPADYQKKEHSLFKEIKTYSKILILIIIIIIVAFDITKYINNLKNKENEENEEEEDKKISKILGKYAVLLLLILIPMIFSSAIYWIKYAIQTPLEYTIKKEGNTIDATKAYKEYNRITSLVLAEKDRIFQEEITGGKEISKTLSHDIYRINTNTGLANKKGISGFYDNQVRNDRRRDNTMNIYYSGLRNIYVLQKIIIFVYNTIADLLIYLIALFFPIVIALNFLPYFQGGIVPILKLVVSLSLWKVILKTINEISYNLGMKQIQSKITALADLKDEITTTEMTMDIYNIFLSNMGYEKYVIAIIITGVLIITPKISSFLISGSQSGSFLSVASSAITLGVQQLTKGRKFITTSLGMQEGLSKTINNMRGKRTTRKKGIIGKKSLE